MLTSLIGSMECSEEYSNLRVVHIRSPLLMFTRFAIPANRHLGTNTFREPLSSLKNRRNNIYNSRNSGPTEYNNSSII